MPAEDYNSLIPQPTDQPSVSQNQLLLNFGAIKDLIDVDHVDFDAVGAGFHKRVTFPVQDPEPVFAPGNIGFYSFLSPVTNVNELYFINQEGAQIQASASILSTDVTPANNAAGWTYLPSGILIKWGHATITGSVTTNFPVSATIPIFNGVMSMQLTTQGSDTDTFVQLASFGATGFIATGTQRTVQAHTAVTFQYLAIGY